jgi:hypothetical protein
MLNSRALLIATIVGTVLQVAMVVASHSNKSRNLFAVGGMGFSPSRIVYAVTGAAERRRRWRSADCSPERCAPSSASSCRTCCTTFDVALALGTVSSAVTGAIGGAIGKFVARG